jgi:salicylate hydroxylase
MRLIVAGGGTGGLTTAIALRHQGIDALVLDRLVTQRETARRSVGRNSVSVFRRFSFGRATQYACAIAP